ncbi:MAG: glycosyltransferase [Leptospiraceae bacterium]|nr:glycosyltransferase [Leptospiraceae bacterium]
MKIYQHVDELNDRDGIGNDILGFQILFEKLNLPNAILTRTNNSKNESEIFLTSKPPKIQSDSIHILHYGGAGYPIDYFQNIPGKKILRFHNMTPSYFFKDFLDEDIFKTFERNEIKSNLELYSLYRCLSWVLSDSVFNELDFLRLVGESNKTKMQVLPVIRNYPLITSQSQPNFRIGFIGRWVPNKRIEDLLFTIYFLRKINPLYTLVLIGKKNSVFGMYNEYLYTLVQELELSNNIEFQENLTDEEVKRQLSKLDIYLSMSEHEGFGIPILEVMASGIPVLAYSSTAILETVRDAGILFNEKNFPYLAELIHKIVTSTNLKSKIVQKQNQRVKFYNEFPFQEKILEIIHS